MIYTFHQCQRKLISVEVKYSQALGKHFPSTVPLGGEVLKKKKVAVAQQNSVTGLSNQRTKLFPLQFIIIFLHF